MNRTERFREISSLHGLASRLAGEVGARLKAGEPPARFVALLREQADALNRLHSHLVCLASQDFSQSDAGTRAELRRLKGAFKSLVQATEDNHRLATQKGIRLTGLGGKPYIPLRRRANR